MVVGAGRGVFVYFSLAIKVLRVIVQEGIYIIFCPFKGVNMEK